MLPDKKALQNADKLLDQRIKEKEELRKKRSTSPIEGKEGRVSRLSNNGSGNNNNNNVVLESSSFTSVPLEDAEVKVEVEDWVEVDVEDSTPLSIKLSLDGIEPTKADQELGKLQSLYRTLVQQQYIRGDENAFVENHPKIHSFQVVSVYFNEKERTFSCPECRKTVTKFAFFEEHLDSHVDIHACKCGMQFANKEYLELHSKFYH